MREYLVKSVSLPKDLVEALEAKRKAIGESLGTDVSFSSALVTTLRRALKKPKPTGEAE